MNGFQIDAVNNALDELRAENAELRADRERLRELFHDHYWDSLVQWRNLILKHVDAVLQMDEARRALEPKLKQMRGE